MPASSRALSALEPTVTTGNHLTVVSVVVMVPGTGIRPVVRPIAIAVVAVGTML